MFTVKQVVKQVRCVYTSQHLYGVLTLLPTEAKIGSPFLAVCDNLKCSIRLDLFNDPHILSSRQSRPQTYWQAKVGLGMRLCSEILVLFQIILTIIWDVVQYTLIVYGLVLTLFIFNFKECIEIVVEFYMQMICPHSLLQTHAIC